jgi:HPt (histidine-containing phosphotransfer) domain-containing protein
MAGARSLDENILSRIRRQSSESFLIRLIDLFLREAPPRLEEAWAGGGAGDFGKVAMAAHTLACLAGNVGAVEVRRLAAAAEEAASRGSVSRRGRGGGGGSAGADRLPALLFDLEVALAEACSCLEAIRAARPDSAR